MGSCQPFASLRAKRGIREKPFGEFVNLFPYTPLAQQLRVWGQPSPLVCGDIV